MAGGSAGELPAAYPFKPEYEVTPVATKRDGLPILDVRLNEEFEFAHVEGSVHVPLHELEDRVDELEFDADEPIAVMCHHGVRSMKAALMLRALGFPKAYSIAGGIELWSLTADAGVPRYERDGAFVKGV